MFLTVEAAAFILWQIADNLTGYFSILFHWLSLICISAGPLPTIVKAVNGKWRWLVLTGVLYIWVWFLLGIVAVVVWFPPGPSPSPHFQLSMQTDECPGKPVMLTNDALYEFTMVSVITNFPNGAKFFNGVPSAFLLIPVLNRESNVAFTFIAKNVSPVTVSDLEFTVCFPKDWNVGVDSTKWQKVPAQIVLGGHELEMTNFQFWFSKCPITLRPIDRMDFDGITNLGAAIMKDASTPVESIKLLIRSGSYEDLLSTSVTFFSVPSNSIRPFLMTGQYDVKSHRFKPSLTQKELIKAFGDSQRDEPIAK